MYTPLNQYICTDLVGLASGNPDRSDLIVQVLLTVITFFAVLIALFQEKIKDFWTKATLQPDINLEPPDCHQIALHNIKTGEFMGNSIYIRIRVKHVSGKSAKNVEAVIAKVEKFLGNEWISVPEFLPMNLQWSHTHTQSVTIPPKSFRHCDLGSFRPITTIVNQFKIDTIVQPNPISNGKIPNLLPPGKYKFEILFSGENVNPILKRWIVEFKPNWSQDERVMLSKNIKISEEGTRSA